MERDLAALGRHVKALQDERMSEAVDLERGRRRLLEATPPRRRRTHLGARVAVASGLVAGAIWIATLMLRPAPLRFEIGGEGRPGQLDSWIAAPAGERLPLVFSDGTRVLLRPGARSQVAGVDGAPLVILGRGEIEVSVVRRTARHWRVDAGPFEVVVTGTKFDLGWEPESERLSLTLREGKVLVSGPIVGKDRLVRAGETLRVSARSAELSLRTDDRPGDLPNADRAGAAGAATPRPVELVPAAAPRPPRAPAVSRPLPAGDPQPRFVPLARDNRYAEALTVAEQEGFETLCRTAEAADLILLGDAARLAGAPSRARAAYEAVRERFGGGLAAHADFLLGRLALHERGDYLEAGRLFDECLREQPDGPFAREATGLLVEARIRAGDLAGARDAATLYLQRYPDGPFAPKARALRGDE